MDKLQVAAISDAAGLTHLQNEWQELAAACSTATVFQSYEWNAVWWRHYGHAPGRRLHLLTVRDSQRRLIGLAPWMTSFWYATPLRRLSFIGTGTSDYLDALALPGQEQTVADALYGELQRMGGWQVADWQQLREGSLLRTCPPGAALRLTCWEALQEPCPYMRLPRDWETLLQSLGKKTRSNVRYHDRALQKVYTVEFGAVQQEDALDAEMTRLFELHQRRWNQRWLPGVFGGKRVQAFHREAARALLKSGFLRLFVLKLDGETEACLYCFAFGERICYYQGGFEPTLAKLSLGTVLTARALEAAIAEGRAVFDFLRGDEPYKAKWTTTAQTNLRRLITRQNTPFGPFMHQMHHMEAGIERRVKSWMRQKK